MVVTYPDAIAAVGEELDDTRARSSSDSEVVFLLMRVECGASADAIEESTSERRSRRRRRG
jgi:hypothetical protein